MKRPQHGQLQPVLLSLVAAAILVASPGMLTAQAASQGPPPGIYTFVPAQSEDVEVAIDRAVSQVSWVIRGFARSRLRGANRPIERIEIGYPGDTVLITLREEDGPIRSPRTGEYVPYTRPDGEVVQVKTELRDSVITQFFHSDDGDKQMVYRLRPAGMLEVVTTIFSDRLKEPLEYTWVFRLARP